MEIPEPGPMVDRTRIADESDRFIEFEMDKTSKVVKVWLIAGREKIEMKKQ